MCLPLMNPRFSEMMRENCFDFVGYNLCKDFVAHIAEGDRSKSAKVGCSFFFRDQSGKPSSFHLLVCCLFEISRSSLLGLILLYLRIVDRILL
jgi:hypothetical protein